jgi:fumarate hydratase class I
VTKDGVFLEQLETNPADYLPEIDLGMLGGEVVKIDLNRPMDEIRRSLSNIKITTRVSLTGPLIVARDLAHAKIKAETIDKGLPLPDYFKNHIIYYAGPAKTPDGYASGAFGPTTAGRMDSFVGPFMEAGGSYVTLAKGNRSKLVSDACKKFGGFYLCSIGGEGALLAEKHIKKVETLAFPELGMEAVWRIDVVDFPAFLVTDDKGNDFFEKWRG